MIKASTIRELMEGKEKAFENIYHSYSRKLFNFCRKYYLTVDQAEEIVQQVFITIWEKKEQLVPEKSFDAYIFTITTNKIKDFYRKKVIKDAFINHTLYLKKDYSFITHEEVYYNELNSLIERTIDKLPQRCREIFILSRFEELSYKDIAEKLEITESTVNTQITKALKMLQEAISETN